MINKKYFFILLYLFILGVFIEVLSYFFLFSKNDSTYPNFNLNMRTHYTDIDKDFGTWHIPNTSFTHKKSCFKVRYNFNSIGARDVEFENNKKNKIFLIGDSIAEGYGLNKEDTIEKNLEDALGLEVLNFGVSGHFGTTQSKILYEKYHKDFDHEFLLHLISVATDFEDDDYNFSMNNKSTRNRYRPYLVYDQINENSYNVIYTNEIINNKMTSLKTLLANFTHTYHVLKYLKSYINRLPEDKIIQHEKNYYEKYDPNVLNIMKYNIVELNKLAKKNNRNYLAVFIPDFNHLKLNKKIDTKLMNEFSLFANKNNIDFIDILKEFHLSEIDIQKIFYNNDNIDCDGHLNPEGAKEISKIILKKFI